MGIKDYDLKKDQLLKKQNLKCASCDKEFKSRNEIQLAHQVIKSKANIKLFGLWVIDHVDNLKATHGGKCNDAVIINRATQPIRAKAHLMAIKESILMELES